MWKEPEYHNEHVWDYIAAKGVLGELRLQRWREFMGVRASDTCMDDLLQSEYRHSAARRERMSYERLMEIVRGPH